MANIVSWIDANKEWLFSGLGLAILGLVIRFIWRKRAVPAQSQRSGSGSVNIQSAGNVKIDRSSLSVHGDDETNPDGR